jgi:hypothetical protein
VDLRHVSDDERMPVRAVIVGLPLNIDGEVTLALYYLLAAKVAYHHV